MPTISICCSFQEGEQYQRTTRAALKFMNPPAATILVVEDDARLRSLAAEVLQTRYKRIILASGSAEGLRLFDADADIGLIFTDVNLPGGPDGVHMARQMREKRPEIPILVSTGDPSFVLPNWSRCTFLPKPYGKTALFAALDALEGLSH